MIALLKDGRTDEQQELVHERFLAMLPQIRRQALVAFRDRGAEARQELAAEVVANAFCAYTRLVRRGKHDLAYPTPLAHFAIAQVRDGRRVGGRQKATDILSPAPAGYTVSRSSGSINGINRLVSGTSSWSKIAARGRPKSQRRVWI